MTVRPAPYAPAVAAATVAGAAHLAAAAGAAAMLLLARTGHADGWASVAGGTLPAAAAGRVTLALAILALAWAGQGAALLAAARRMAPGRRHPWRPDGHPHGRRASVAAAAAALPSLPLLAAVGEPAWAWLALPAAAGAAAAALGLRLHAWQAEASLHPPRRRPTAWACPRCTRAYSTVLGHGIVPRCPQCG